LEKQDSDEDILLPARRRATDATVFKVDGVSNADTDSEDVEYKPDSSDSEDSAKTPPYALPCAPMWVRENRAFATSLEIYDLDSHMSHALRAEVAYMSDKLTSRASRSRELMTESIPSAGQILSAFVTREVMLHLV
jgi:hypothetical protein